MSIPGRDALMSTAWGYRAYMALRWGTQRREAPRVNPVNTVLKTKAEVEEAVAEAARLRLPQFSDPPKTWDTLGALHEIVSRTDTNASVLDAGAEMYSRILPWLYLYGYRNLTGNNLVFDKSAPSSAARSPMNTATSPPRGSTTNTSTPSPAFRWSSMAWTCRNISPRWRVS